MKNSFFNFQPSVTAFAFSLFIFFNRSAGQIQINSTSSPVDMVSNLAGPGIIFSNVTYTGAAQASAIFSNGSTTNLGLNSGVVLTTGSAGLIPGNDGGNQGVSNNLPGVPLLNFIAGAQTFDGLILEFDFIPLSNQINVNYVFGSEEYLEFVNAGYNDAFAFFISGPGIVGQQNIALIGGQPVTIQNVNHITNSAYFIDNTTGIGPNSIEYDGFTTVLTATAEVIPCSTYHVKLMIADGADYINDSGVFIAENGFYSPNAQQHVTVQLLSSFSFGFNNLVEGCGEGQFVFSIPAPVLTDTVINFSVGGTATPDDDYLPLPDFVTIPAGQTSVALPVTILNDGLIEGPETIVLTVATSPCGSESFSFVIEDPSQISVSAADITMCQGAGPVIVSASATGGNGTINYVWSYGLGTGPSVSVNPDVSAVYSVTATDQCGQTASDSAAVTVIPVPTSSFSTDGSVCQGSSSTVTYTGNALPGATYLWDFGGGSAVPGGNLPGPHTVTWPGTGNMNISLTVSQDGCTSEPTELTVVVNPIPAPVIIGPNTPVCEGGTLFLSAVAVPGATFIWTGPNGWSSNKKDNTLTDITEDQEGNYSVFLVVNGCTSAVSNLQITVNPTPQAPVLSSNSPLCAGEDLQLNADGIAGAVYVWSGPNGFSSDLAAPEINNVSVSNSGNYSAYVVVDGCASPFSVLSVTVNPIPVSPAIEYSSPVCEGGTLGLSANTIPGATYFWTGPQGWTSSSEDPLIANVSQVQSGQYSLFVSVNGCTSAVSYLLVTISPIPQAPVLSSNSPVCEGTDLILNTDSYPGAYYFWSGPGGFYSESEDPLISSVSLSASGNYSLYIVVNGCTSATSIMPVTVNLMPASDFTIPPTVCLGNETSALYAGNAPALATYNWSVSGNALTTGGGQGPFTILWEDEGQQTVSLYVSLADCISPVTSKNVEVIAPIIPDAGSDRTLCSGEQVYVGNIDQQGQSGYTWLTDYGIDDPTSGYSKGSWINEDTTVHTVVLVLEYYYQGCSATDTAVMHVVPIPSFSVQQPSPQCLEGNSFAFSANGNILTSADYFWSFEDAVPASSGVVNPSNVVFLSEGTHQVVLSVEQYGCSFSDTVSVSLNPSPSVSFTYDIGQGCMPLTINFVNQSFSRTGDSLSFSWNFGNGLVSYEDSPSAVYPEAGIYGVSLTATDPIGCSSTVTMNNIIHVHPLPVAGFSAFPMSVYIDQPLVNVQDRSSGSVFQWSYSISNGMQFSTPDFSISFSDTGNFSITQTVTDEFGCSASASSEVQVLPVTNIFIPTAFTPGNGDNLNNTFGPRGNQFESYRMFIFNRWGEMIFSTMNPDEGWDGTIAGSGVPAKEGIYVYKVDYLDHKGNTQVLSGNVMLIR